MCSMEEKKNHFGIVITVTIRVSAGNILCARKGVQT